MAVVAVIGFAITLRSRMLSIGVLSLVGGYASPVLLSGASTFAAALPSWLTALLAVGLALSAWSPRPFRPLRYVAMGLHGVVALAWVLDVGGGRPMLALIFGGLWWGMLLVEVTYAAMRRESPNGNVVASLIASGWFATLGCWLLGPTAGAFDWRGLFALGIAGVAGATALQFGPGVEVLRHRPKAPIDRLSLALWIQSGILLVVAVALQFTGFAEVTAWLAIALGAIEAGRRLRSLHLQVFGVLVLLLAIARAVLVDSWATATLGRSVWAVGAVDVTGWTLLSLVAIAGCIVAARRISPSLWGGLAFAGRGLMALGVAYWFIVWSRQASGPAATALWLVAPVALLAVVRLAGWPDRALAAVSLAAVAARWLIADGILARLDPGWDADLGLPIMNPTMLVAAAITAVGWWSGRALRTRSGESTRSRDLALLAIAGFALVALSFEIDRILAATSFAWLAAWPPLLQRGLAWVVLWSAGGAIIARLGERRGNRRAGVAGVAIVCVASLAWLTWCTVGARIAHGPVPAAVGFNPQFLAGALSLAMLAIMLAPGRILLADASWSGLRAAIPVLMGLTGLWLGTLEVDRACAAVATAPMVWFAMFWVLFGAGLVVVGFLRRDAVARYAGLALLGIALVILLVVLMLSIGTAWRIVAGLGLAVVLIATSVLYAKFAPRVLGETAD
jgi:hypothetical protein